MIKNHWTQHKNPTAQPHDAATRHIPLAAKAIDLTELEQINRELQGFGDCPEVQRATRGDVVMTELIPIIVPADWTPEKDFGFYEELPHRIGGASSLLPLIQNKESET